jgi:hypothetical protein
MEPSWQKLRTWKTSHQEAFEELCCQLAHDEAVPKPASFVRVGPPDSGVECYWQFPGGNEWGWQSKFTDSSGVWTQIEDSFEQAFKKRPKLVRYTVCIPFSLSEGKYKKTKKSNKKSGRDKWDSFVKKWTLFAKRKGRKIDFDVWDDHELWNRLSKSENAGRRLFWFGDVILDQKWFSDRAEATIVQAGDRYDAVLNISLPQKDLFAAVARTAEFWKHLEEKAKSFQRVFSHAIDNCRDDQVTGEITEIAVKFKETLAAINLLGKSEREHLDYEKITLRLGELRQTCYKLDKRLSELDAIAREEYKIKHNREAGEYDNPRDGFSWHTRNTLISELSSLTEFLSCKESRLSNSPYLLLTGEAGSGKTHLLCETASTLLKEGAPAIFLMGDQFNNEEPWSQIVKLLGLNASTEDFLGALDAAASASKLRAMIIIDALNEGPGVTFWTNSMRT